MDEVSQAIGKLQGQVEGLGDSVEKIADKLDIMHTEQTNQKINTAKLSMKVGFFASVLALGLIEGARFYAKTHWGN